MRKLVEPVADGIFILGGFRKFSGLYRKLVYDASVVAKRSPVRQSSSDTVRRPSTLPTSLCTDPPQVIARQASPISASLTAIIFIASTVLALPSAGNLNAIRIDFT